ncbi:MAG: DNA alkylation repair protein [Gemmatimonadaceae bacterium]
MADTLKSLFNERMIRSVADDLKKACPALDVRRFMRDALAGLEELELTARGSHVAEVMRLHLPEPYEKAIEIIIASFGAEHANSETFGFEPFRYLPHATFIARHGLDHFELSMRAQHELTRRFTAEGSIRPYIVRHPEQTMARLREWTRDPDVHVRRLVSEGTRPRLPWSSRLREFQRDPAPVLELLELLKDDPERYVQRSIANNLNDIAKDHPDLVVEVAKRWMKGATDGRRWIVGHALRSLVKAGHPGALAVMGAGGRPRVEVHGTRLTPKRVALGGTLAFSFELRSTAKSTQTLMVDYAVHFVKSNGERRPKVFKLKKVEIAGGETLQLSGRVSFAPMTTRTSYAGRHSIEARINGVPFPLGEFDVRA